MKGKAIGNFLRQCWRDLPPSDRTLFSSWRFWLRLSASFLPIVILAMLRFIGLWIVVHMGTLLIVMYTDPFALELVSDMQLRQVWLIPHLRLSLNFTVMIGAVYLLCTVCYKRGERPDIVWQRLNNEQCRRFEQEGYYDQH